MTDTFYDLSLLALLMGIIATAILDLSVLGLKMMGASTTNWALVGRWVVFVSRGQFGAIANGNGNGTKVRFELVYGWLFHYIVGVIYSLLFLLICQGFSLPVSLGGALGFGILTVLAPWLILQPGLGLGLFAANTPKPAKTRLLNLTIHSIFGFSLFIAWKILTQLVEIL
ncbi:MAG: DUF2938 domain-containing protein [Gammaproteobacteria bacterium]|nr:DUF2938 domain-containing protein [Gammaproteobacteria bacterium]MDH5694034.1 DUF2938 domain-containing protein [Gammaproteobacteria bacterium]